MNRRAAYDGLPLVEPMYWNHGGGTVPTEFEFGTELIVSPVLEPADQAAGRAKAEVWLPVGQWFDFFDGRRYVADNPEGRTLGVWRTLDRIPVFAKAGASYRCNVSTALHSTMFPTRRHSMYWYFRAYLKVLSPSVPERSLNP